MTHMRSRKPCETLLLDRKDDSGTSKLQKRRWRMAFTAIYFARLLVSLSKKVVDKRPLRSLSYVSINFNDDTLPLSLMDVDQKILIEMVKEKNLDYLNQLGGVIQVATSLETDVKAGISGTEADLTHRRAVFGSNTHQKPPTRSFLSFVFDSVKDTTIIILSVCAFLSLAFGVKQHGPKEGWYDGGNIIIAVFLVVALSAASNFKQSRQFKKLCEIND